MNGHIKCAMIYIAEYCSAIIKRNDVLIHATIRVNLDDVMYRERSHSQRPHVIWFHLHEISRIKSARLLAGRGGGGGQKTGTGCESVENFFFGDMVVMVAPLCELSVKKL